MTRKKKPRYGLLKKFTKRPARAFMDADYLHKLNEDELAFLEHFNREFYQNTFSNDGFDLHPPRTPSRKRCYDAENARNRDIWNKFERSTEDAGFSIPRQEDEE